jgi:hypothetical protein
MATGSEVFGPALLTVAGVLLLMTVGVLGVTTLDIGPDLGSSNGTANTPTPTDDASTQVGETADRPAESTTAQSTRQSPTRTDAETRTQSATAVPTTATPDASGADDGSGESDDTGAGDDGDGSDSDDSGGSDGDNAGDSDGGSDSDDSGGSDDTDAGDDGDGSDSDDSGGSDDTDAGDDGDGSDSDDTDAGDDGDGGDSTDSDDESGGDDGSNGDGGETTDDGSDDTNGTAVAVESVTVPVDGSARTPVVLEHAPHGMSGFQLTVTVEPGTATIENATVAAAFEAVSDVSVAADGSSVTVEAVDLDDSVSSNATDVELVNLTVAGVEAGTTTLELTVDRFEDDNTTARNVTTTNGDVAVQSTQRMTDSTDRLVQRGHRTAREAVHAD